MLTTKKITLETKCVADGAEIASFRAVFDAENPGDVSFYPFQMDKEACKTHRKIVREDQAAFEDYAYGLQETLINK